MATIPSGLPTAETTGVPPGTTLNTYNGTLVVRTDNAVIDGLLINGNVVIEADNVTLRNVKIVSSTDWHAIYIADGYKGFTLVDSEIDGRGRTVNGVLGTGTFLRNDIHGVHNGINTWGTPTSPTLIQDNYIHDLRGDSDAHYDGIEINGGSNIRIIHNTIINDHDQTSAIMLDNYFDGLSNITVDGNFLYGGGYTVYLDGRFGGGAVDDSSIRITNNQIVEGYWGAFAFYDHHPVQTGNVVNGAVGADIITGGPGNDIHYVDNAADQVIEVVNGGTDTVHASASWKMTAGQELENLTLTGSAHINGTGNGLNNTLLGNTGNNLLNGGTGADRMEGKAGNDTYYVDNAGDRVIEANGQGTDGVNSAVTFTLAGQYIEKLTLTGSASINGSGNSLNNLLIGNAGNNVLNGSTGADRMEGKAGHDTYSVDNAGDRVIEANGQGTDKVNSSVTFNLAGQYIEKLTLTGSAHINAVGNGLNNTLIGNAANNVLNGSTGADWMEGKAGNDAYVVDNAGDRVIEANGQGTDRMYSSVTFNLAGQYIEKLTLTGSAHINAVGNGLNNTLIGNAANNVLNGSTGRDTLTGASGNDHFVFSTAPGASNLDTITDYSVASDTIRLENGIFTAIGAPGTLAAAAFRVGTSAADATDRIIYNKATGALLYDADGSGAGAAVQFATLDDGLALTRADFLIV